LTVTGISPNVRSSNGDDDAATMEDDMYTLSTNNGITKTFNNLADAQAYCTKRFAKLTWEQFDAHSVGDGLEWHGFDGDSDEADAIIALDAEELLAWATKQAEMHIADVRSMGAEPSPADAANWEGIEQLERRAIRDAIRDALQAEQDAA
jgi:hypothetical protein